MFSTHSSLMLFRNNPDTLAKGLITKMALVAVSEYFQFGQPLFPNQIVGNLGASNKLADYCNMPVTSARQSDYVTVSWVPKCNYQNPDGTCCFSSDKTNSKMTETKN